MTSHEFEDECHTRISGWLWDSTWNPDYSEKIHLTIDEMRSIALMLRKRFKRKAQCVRPWSEEEEKKSCE